MDGRAAGRLGQGGGCVKAVATPNGFIEVTPALRHCRTVTRQRARNFYYGLKLLPQPQRWALFAVYAWMRAADDLVDSAHGHATAAVQLQIDDFRAATNAALAGNPVNDDSLWRALADISSRFHLPSDYFNSMLDGQLDDLAHGRYETFDHLRNYCYRVASTVGLLCIEIWGYEDPVARDLAIDRGIAFQLTNIIRDYKQDYDAGRIYLPIEDFERHGIDPKILRNWSKPNACTAMMQQQMQRAASFYDRSAGLDDLISPCCRPTLWAMTTIYRALLEKMRRDPAKLVLTKRLRLSAMRKGTIAIRAQWQARAARQLPVHAPVRVPAPLVEEVSSNSTA